MAGLYTPGVPQLAIFTGSEQFAFDTELSGGAEPQTAMSTLVQLAAALKVINTAEDKTTVAGTRYYVGITIGNEALLTGVQALVGSTGGTDKWIYELHDSTGALVATTATAGVTTGTANLFQRIPFTAQYLALPGQYYIAVQSNGTTAKLATYASAGLPLVDGSAAGTFGTGAAITPPTTYTANLAPIATLY